MTRPSAKLGWDSPERFNHYVDNLNPNDGFRVYNQDFTSFTTLINFIHTQRSRIIMQRGEAMPIEAALYLLERMRPYMIHGSYAKKINWSGIELPDRQRNQLVADLKDALRRLPPPAKAAAAQPDANTGKTIFKFPNSEDPDPETVKRIIMAGLEDRCPICHERIPLKSLYEHILSIHDDKPVVCRHCLAAWKAENLAKHLVKKHYAELSVKVSTPIPPPQDEINDRRAQAYFYESLCLVLPSETLAFFAEKNIHDLVQLGEFLHTHQEAILQNEFNLSADEVMLILRKINQQNLATLYETQTISQFTELRAKFTGSPLLKNVLTPNETSSLKSLCPVCRKMYSVDWLRWHMVTYHAQQNQPWVYCLYCTIKVPSNTLVDHLKVRHPDKVFPVGNTIDEKDGVLLPEEANALIPGEPPVPAMAHLGYSSYFAMVRRTLPVEIAAFLEEKQIEELEQLLEYVRDHHEAILQGEKDVLSPDETFLLLKSIKYERILKLHGLQWARLHNTLVQSFKRPASLMDLVGKTETSRLKSFCPSCKKPYPLNWLRWHMATQHDGQTVNCLYCQNQVPSSEFVDHLKKEHRNQLLLDYADMDAEVKAAIPSPTSSLNTPPGTVQEETYQKSVPAQRQSPAQPAEEQIRLAAEAAILPPQQPEPAPIAEKAQNRLTGLREIRPVQRRSARPMQISAQVEDRSSLVSQAARVKTERANQVHAATLQILMDYIAVAGAIASETFLIDAYADIQGPQIFEIKSLSGLNEKSQIRHAIAQLYEYRYLYHLPGAGLWLVLSAQPETRWILDYLIKDREIRVLWVLNGSLAGASLPTLKALLAG